MTRLRIGCTLYSVSKTRHPLDNIQIEHRTIRSSVTDRLRALILNRKLKPGERLMQDELAAQLGVSRTPIREALHQLAAEGLVTFSPYRGAYVPKPTVTDLEAIYSVRIALEGYAGYLAAQYITDEEVEQLEAVLRQMEDRLAQRDLQKLMELNRRFNTTLFAASRQPRLSDLAVEYMHMADAYRRLHLSVENLATQVIAEHRDMLNALRQHDPLKVMSMTQDQLHRSVCVLKEFFDSNSG